MTPLTKSQFRWLLVIYCAVVVGMFAAQSITKPMIPESVVRAEKASDNEAFSEHGWPVGVSVGLMLVGVLLAGLVGLVGMFFLWRPGLYIFFIAVCVRTLASPLAATWQAVTGWNSLFDDLGLLLEGVIFGIAFFGPAKHLFRRE